MVYDYFDPEAEKRKLRYDRMPRHLVEFVVCHELLHLNVPTHSRMYRLLLSRHVPDWREREGELGRWVLLSR